MAYTESNVRDNLAKNLEILEPGLNLICTEHYLPSGPGSRGFVDILARDRHGLLVVIELKKSDTAARQCIHELFKYTGLLAENNGIRADEVRCIAVSTTWRELVLPFSELYHTKSIQLTGYHLMVDDKGKPLSAKSIEPLPPQKGIELCPEHLVFLYENDRERQKDLRRLQENFARLAFPDYVLLEQNYMGSDERVIHPFALYVALPLMPSINTINTSELNHDVAELVVKYSNDEDCDFPFETAIYVLVQKDLSPSSVEISFPDKIVTMMNDQNWAIRAWHNGGRLAIGAVRLGETVVSELSGLDSGQGTNYHKILSPQNQIAWARAVKNLALHTNWCEGWKTELFSFLGTLEGRGVTVSIALYAPDDMLQVLYKTFSENDPSSIPRLEIVVSDESGILDVLVGSIKWNGIPVNDSLHAFFLLAYQNVEGYRWSQFRGEQRVAEKFTCEFFNVDYTVQLLADHKEGWDAAFDIVEYKQANANILLELDNTLRSYPIVSI